MSVIKVERFSTNPVLHIVHILFLSQPIPPMEPTFSVQGYADHAF